MSQLTGKYKITIFMEKYSDLNCVDYLIKPMKHRDIVIKQYRQALKGIKFSHIVVCGTSGLIIGPVLAPVLKKELIIVRKKNEKTHSSLKLETISSFERKFNYIIVDDLVDSGNTMRHILKTMDGKFVNSHLTGIYVYGKSWTNLILYKEKYININTVTY